MSSTIHVNTRLEKAIWANPEDDAPRLVYADWLDRNEQLGAAEFMRLQCQAARLAEEDPRRRELELRAGNLEYSC